MTLVAAPITVCNENEVSEALARANRAVDAGARLIEWRIDALPAHVESDAAVAAAITVIRPLIAKSPAPCILTCRVAAEGGAYYGSEARRIAVLTGVAFVNARPPRYIDLELASDDAWATLAQAIARNNEKTDLPTSLILSSHDFAARPADLLQRIERMTNDPACDVVKVAWRARSIRDNLEAFDLLTERRKPTIALCMGEFGLMSRVLAPKFGALLTFACLDEEEASAPGQPTLDELINRYRFHSIGGETSVYGVIGWPVHHSRGPHIHNAGFGAIGFDGVYLPLPVPTEYEHFKATVASLVDHERLDFRGASITIPHKENLIRFVAERGGTIDPLAASIGAANTLIVNDDRSLHCLNTDAPAAIDSLCAGMSIESGALAGQRAAVLGAGGVARAIVAALMDAGVSVSIFNRTHAKAKDLAAEREAASGDKGSVSAQPIEAVIADRFDIYINCTSVGMIGGPAPEASPLPDDALLDENATVFDAIYNPLRTPLLQQAEARGARTISGLDMFIRQAALQFERWTGQAAPVDVFERVLRENLA